MTILEKIIARATDGKVSQRGKILSPDDIVLRDKLSSDALCGAYGALCSDCVSESVTVAESVFVNLDGALRDDASEQELAEYIKGELAKENIAGLCVEFGGDSLTYLTMNDRFAIVRELLGESPFCVIFESDFNTALFLEERKERVPMFLNDGPHNYKKVITLNLCEI